MDSEKIKEIVRKNFDESAEIYATFEDEYQLFKKLTKELSDFCNICKKKNVLDIGCGTGTSTVFVSELIENGIVIGIDISEQMLKKAQTSLRPNIKYILGDAENLTRFVSEKFDAIVYNATLFLIPNPRRTLEQAKILSTDDGTIGASYFLSLYSNGIDVLEDARKKGLCADGRFVMEKDLKEGFSEVFGNCESRIIDIPMTKKEIEDFHMIPAQSAGLFPKRPYLERATLVQQLFSRLGNTYTDFSMKWGLLKANKS